MRQRHRGLVLTSLFLLLLLAHRITMVILWLWFLGLVAFVSCFFILLFRVCREGVSTSSLPRSHHLQLQLYMNMRLLSCAALSGVLLVVLATSTPGLAFYLHNGGEVVVSFSSSRRRPPMGGALFSAPIVARLQATNSKVEGSGGSGSMDLDLLKSELLKYLEKRKELGADDLAAAEVGKIVGGTKGNAILEYVSGSPNKETRVEVAPNVLDYDQLVKYGYSHLVTPIMKAGGRLAMYRLLDMEPPDTSKSLKPLIVTAPKLVIDREGKTDKARYSGLKLGQVLDDNMQAEALANAQERSKRGEALRKPLQEESYEQPFADKRNVGPQMTPDWTPEKLDEWGRKQGKAQAWARRAREGEFVKDPLETTELGTEQRVFSILTSLMVATAFGKSTPTFLVQMSGLLDDEAAARSILGTLQAPAAGLLVASMGSLFYCAVQASEKNRDPVVWSIKGLLGGPFSIKSLRESEALLTQAQDSERKKQESQRQS